MSEELIEIKGVVYRMVQFLDENAEETNDPSEACTVLLQLPEDRRPEGVEQRYKAWRCPKGTIKKIVSQ